MMGNISSSQKYIKTDIDTKINNCLLEYIPLFLNNHCKVEKSLFMDPLQFWIAFQSFLRAKKIDAPSQFYEIKNDWVKYYFHEINKLTGIYVTGAAKYNVLVGVSIQTWPGTPETDNRACRSDHSQCL